MPVTIDVGELKTHVVKEHVYAIKHKTRPTTLNFEGPPGIGKTFSVYAAAKEIGKQIKEDVIVKNIMTSTLDPCDLAGVPMPVDGMPYCEYKPLGWAYDLCTESPNQGPAILFLDDFTVAHPQTQAAGFKLVHEYMAGPLTIRDNVLIVLAGNRAEDKAAANEMPTPLANRMRNFSVEVNFDIWMQWAIRSGVIHPFMIAFLKTHQDLLHKFDPNSAEKAWPSPRSWELASKAIAMYGDSEQSLQFNSIAATVGEGVAQMFVAKMKNMKACIPPEEICKDPEKARVPKPQDLDAVHATFASLQTYLTQHPDVWEKVIRYILRKEHNDDFIIPVVLHVSYIMSESLSKAEATKAVSSDAYRDLIKRYANYIVLEE